MRTHLLPAAVRAALVLMPALPVSAAVAQTPARTATPPQPMPMPMDAGAPPCPATPAALPPELAGWSAAVPVHAARTPAELALATIQPGRGASATLLPVGQVSYPVAPGHPGEPGTSGGLFAFAVTQAGSYRVALGGAAWVDVVKDGQIVASTAHGHGPACGPVRKMVDFTLAPGRYLLELSGGKAATLALMVAPLPR